MYRSKIAFLAFLLVLALASCVKRYEPVIDRTDAVKYVITGQVNKGESVQRINVGTSSSFIKPEVIPITGCIVKIIDGKGNIYPATDAWEGNYDVIIPESELVAGNTFKVDILLQGGDHLVSDFDQMQDAPDIDSVYYITQKLPTDSPVLFTRGIQFYLDLDAGNSTCRNYRWEATETWEYHSLYPIEWYWNGRLHHNIPPDSSKMVCWRTSKLRDVYMLTTRTLSENKYKRFPLQFVDNSSSSRLVYGYSLLVKQFSMSDAAYEYWEKIRANSQDQGGLYESQPMVIKGNMHNLTKPDQDVLGFFGAASVKQKRIFVKNVPDLPLEYVFNCVIDDLPKGGLAGTYPIMYPVYLPAHTSLVDGVPVYWYDLLSIDHECVDCTATVGGTTTKPDYWPY